MAEREKLIELKDLQITFGSVSYTHLDVYKRQMYGGCNYKAVNWETSEEAYTTVKYEQFAKAFNAAIQG